MQALARFLILFLLLCGLTADAAGKASHVVILVWDGMRPDFVSQENTPTLFALANEGTTFKNHHPVYISTTEVNGTALATGAYPGVSSVVANAEFRPEINPTNSVATEALKTIRKGDKLSGNQYLKVATLAETLQASGLHTIVAGTKPVAALQDRAARTDESLGINLFEGVSLPESVAVRMTNLLGKFPALGAYNKTQRDIWTTSALTGPLWDAQVPAFSLLWLGEPDGCQHATAPGSPLALRTIKTCDFQLARVLAALDKKNLRDSTDVIVVSDHGFSTIDGNLDVVALLKAHGFRAFRQFPTATPAAGDILVVGGSSALFYVTGHEPAAIEKLVHFLQSQPFCGVVFAKQPVEGAFSLQDAKLDCATAPDVVVSMHWSAGKNTFGAPGLECFDGGASKLNHKGMHGSLSAYDMHNICFAAGPDFQRGVVDSLGHRQCGHRPHRPVDPGRRAQAAALRAGLERSFDRRRSQASILPAASHGKHLPGRGLCLETASQLHRSQRHDLF